MTLPWLPTTSSTKRLEKDLQERGWRLWWTQHGTVRLFAPDGARIEISGNTEHQVMSNAYASAQEYANAQTGELLRDELELSYGLDAEVRA